MKIGVVGTGYVGLVTGACFAEFGVDVCCVDTDAAKVARLRDGHIPIHEPGLEELVQKNLREGRLQFTTSHEEATADALAIFIAVGTPSLPGGEADLSYVTDVARTIGEQLNGYKVIVTKATVPAGTGAMIRKVIEETLERRRARGERTHSFSIASNPEFLREGSAVEDFLRPNRVVIGADDDQAVAILKDLYRPLYLIETPIVVTDVVTAELIKYASNAFLAMKVSYINEIANLAEELGADVHMVAKGMGLDQRIGSKFLHPGPGYGGSCFPKDTRALAHIGRNAGVPMQLVEAAIRVNDAQMGRMAEKVRRALGRPVQGATVAVLGLSFKPSTDDLRESRSMALCRILLAEGATVRAHDPVALQAAKAELPALVACSDPMDAARGADLLVLATEWNQYRRLDLARLRELLEQPQLLDLRNVYDREQATAAGLRYEGVGRGGRIR
jgi:UDPglucose 6-dehydrogenase